MDVATKRDQSHRQTRERGLVCSLEDPRAKLRFTAHSLVRHHRITAVRQLGMLDLHVEVGVAVDAHLDTSPNAVDMGRSCSVLLVSGEAVQCLVGYLKNLAELQ